MKECPKCIPAPEDRIKQLEKDIEDLRHTVTKHMNVIGSEYKKYISSALSDFEKVAHPTLQEIREVEHKVTMKLVKLQSDNLKSFMAIEEKLDRKINKFWWW